jgi:hypothetical protein
VGIEQGNLVKALHLDTGPQVHGRELGILHQVQAIMTDGGH